jgi:hypothetical protein
MLNMQYMHYNMQHMHTHPAYRRTPFLYDSNKKYDIICTKICKICTYPILVPKNAKICLLSPAYQQRVGRVLQLAVRGTKDRARLGWPFFCRKEILKTMMFRDVRTISNERKHLKMVITRSVPDSVSLVLGRTE